MPPRPQLRGSRPRVEASSTAQRTSPAGATVRPARRSESLETQAKILDAAESLFLETGFAATSLRAIAGRAGVNLAAAHYHFGSKEGLLDAAFHRRIAPLNSTRLRALDALEARTESPNVRAVMRAFLQPLASVDAQSVLPRLVGRLYSEPASVSKPLIEREFSEISARFLEALSNALPDVPPDALRWRFHFVIGSMIHLLSFEKPPIETNSEIELSDGLDHLLEFAVNGLDPAQRKEHVPAEDPTQ